MGSIFESWTTSQKKRVGIACLIFEGVFRWLVIFLGVGYNSGVVFGALGIVAGAVWCLLFWKEAILWDKQQVEA